MKIHVAYDRDGRVLAAVLQPDAEAGPSVHLAPQAGSDVAEFDAPAQFEGKRLDEFMHLVRVDKAGKRLVVA
jgi:hypothetical protein